MSPTTTPHLALLRRRRFFSGVVLACVVFASGCSLGPVRRVSEPAVSIQQLSVRSDGQWSVEVRLQNYSSVQMRFDTLAVDLQIDGQTAGQLRASPALDVGPESADVTTVTLQPASQARIAIAGALADGRSVNYSLRGDVNATAKDGKPREYRIKRDSALSPVPGMPGVLR